MTHKKVKSMSELMPGRLYWFPDCGSKSCVVKYFSMGSGACNFSLIKEGEYFCGRTHKKYPAYLNDFKYARNGIPNFIGFISSWVNLSPYFKISKYEI